MWERKKIYIDRLNQKPNFTKINCRDLEKYITKY